MSDWAELKRLAEAAKAEGEWFEEGCALYSYYDRPDADFMVAASPETILALIAENERLARGLAFTEQWYAVRMERLGDLGKARGIWPEMAAIIANGTVDHQEPPTYAQQLVRANHRAKEAEAERDQFRAEVEALLERAEYWKQRAKSAEGHLFTSDWRAARHALHMHTALASTPWEELTDAQKTQISSAAGAVIAEVNARRDVRMPHDAAMSKGVRSHG